jgi:hypothetical protein
MPSLEKSLRRERKQQKRKNGMHVDNRNIFVLEREKRKKAEEIRKRREEKEKLVLETP